MFSYSKTQNFEYFSMIGCSSNIYYCTEKWYMYDFHYSVNERAILVGLQM